MQAKQFLRQVLILAAFLMPGVTEAALVPCSGLDCDVQGLLGLVYGIFNWLIGSAGLVALGFIIWGGLRMLYWSFMEDDERELAASKHTVTRAILGLVIVASSWLVINTLVLLMSGGTQGINDFLKNLDF